MIKVLAIDDSAVVRRGIERLLSGQPDIQLVGTAPDPFVGRNKIVALDPDVVLLDLEMPRMDGITFLRKLMQSRPMPVIVLSSITQGNSRALLEALSAGAFDVVSKPRSAHTLEEVAEQLIERIRAAKSARVNAGAKAKKAQTTPVSPATLGDFENSHQLLVIGASTGGTRALEVVLEGLPRQCPAVMVTQHMPAEFTRSFAERLNQLSELRVKEAEHGDLLTCGMMVIAPGNRHMELERSGALYRVSIHDGERVNRHRPSVDVMFNSVAKHAGANAVGAILTGMGDDGARGLLAMRKAGAATIAQDQASSVVYGMPKAAVALGAAAIVCPLDQVAQQMLRCAQSIRAKVG